MVNQEIAEIFNNMSAYFEMSTEKNAFFKARAYRVAAETLGKFPYDLSLPEWQNLEKLKKIEGIGQSTGLHIIEYIKTKKVKEYEDMKAKSPVKLEELLKVQGIGPKKILKLYKELKVTDIESLKKAAESNEISKLEGFGDKSQGNILESIEFAITNKDRKSIALVEPEIQGKYVHAASFS